MYLKVSKNSKTQRIYLSAVHNYRDEKTGQPRTSTIKSFGYLDELEKQYDNPIEHFKAIVSIMNEEREKQSRKKPFNISMNERIDKNSINRKNLGYAAASRVYHELCLDDFFKNKQRYLNIEYSINNIVKLLVFSQLLEPCSKKQLFENKEWYFEHGNFSLDELYQSLEIINRHKEELQLWLHKKIIEHYKRDTKLVYYNVADYYFETNEPEKPRKKGLAKEQFISTVIQMGLVTDSMGIPMAYQLLKGSGNSCSTLIPILKQTHQEYNLGKIIVVADEEMNTSENIYFSLREKIGYIFGHTVIGGSKEFKRYALSNDGYEWFGADYKRKSRIYSKEIIIAEGNKKIKMTVDQKQVVLYSKSYDKKTKQDRLQIIDKARQLAKNPAKYNAATDYDAAKYVKNLETDKKADDPLAQLKKPVFDEEKLREEEKYDGYYAIVTNEYKVPDDKIIEIYKGLRETKYSFRVTQSDFELPPAYSSYREYIESHFLICFITQVLVKIIQHRTNNKYSINQIVESLKKISGSRIQQNIYLFDYYDDVIEDIGDALNIDFSKKYLELNAIRKLLGDVKRR